MKKKEEIKKSYNKKYSKVFMLAKILKARYKFCVVNNKLRVYDQQYGYYKIADKDTCKQLAYEIMKKNSNYKFSIADLNQIYDAILLDKRLYKDLPTPSPDYINCMDCVWNVVSGEKYSHSPKFGFTYYIHAKMSSENKVDKSIWDSFIDDLTCSDKDLKKLLQEWSGYLISSLTNEKKFAILYGPSNSGKSVYLNILSELIGEENVSHTDIKHITNEFYLEQMCQNRVNICNDISGNAITDLSNIKQITSDNDTITIRKPRCSPVSTKDKPKLMFAANILPNVNSSPLDLEAYFNRVIILPCLNSVKNPDRDLSRKILDNKTAVLLWLGKGLKRYLNQNGFSESETSLNTLKRYRLEYCIVQEFINDKIKFKDGKKVFTKDLEKALKKYASENGVPYKNQYMSQLRSVLKERNVENKKIRIKDKSPKQGFVGIKLC